MQEMRITAWYSSVASATLAFKAVGVVVWDADSFVTAKVYVTGLTDTLLQDRKNTQQGAIRLSIRSGRALTKQL